MNIKKKIEFYSPSESKNIWNISSPCKQRKAYKLSCYFLSSALFMGTIVLTTPI